LQQQLPPGGMGSREPMMQAPMQSMLPMQGGRGTAMGDPSSEQFRGHMNPALQGGNPPRHMQDRGGGHMGGWW
ncbi:hypothetical protein CYMTET_8911, partial [Cymbomonas tetramitiformis]